MKIIICSEDLKEFLKDLVSLLLLGAFMAIVVVVAVEIAMLNTGEELSYGRVHSGK